MKGTKYVSNANRVLGLYNGVNSARKVNVPLIAVAKAGERV